MKEESKKELKLRRSHKIRVNARNRDFKPCNYDQKKLRIIVEALIEEYPEMENLNIGSEGISFSFKIDPEKLLEKHGSKNPSSRA